MKKNAVILFFLAIVILAVTAAASAQTVASTPDPYKFNSKSEYYDAIELRLKNIAEALKAQDKETANKQMDELRQIVYRCARYLADIKEYDWRILYIITYTEEAFKEGADIDKEIEEARLLACQILMPSLCPTPTTTTYPYFGGVVDSGTEDGGEEDSSHS